MTETLGAATEDELLTSMDIVCEAGITYRQMDYWERRGFLRAAPHPLGLSGYGIRRIWPKSELDVAQTMGRLVKLGLPLERAHAIARSGQRRTQVAPGIWLELGPPLSGPCDRDDHGTCFPEEPSSCGCACHEPEGRHA